MDLRSRRDERDRLRGARRIGRPRGGSRAPRTDGRTDGTKRFTWRQPDGTPGLGGIPVVDLPLYGIDRLDGMASAVVVVEGEKCAEALWGVGISAVGTVTGAATTPGPSALAELGGRGVILWPDADAVGKNHMAAIADRPTGVATSVRIVDPPNSVPAGGDAADAVDEGRDIAAILAEPLPPTLAAALTALETRLRRYVVLSRPEEVVAVVLWVAHTHAIASAEATPYLAISSPEKQSGRTRLLELLRHLARGCSGILIIPTASTIYRTLEATPGATLLLDELDAAFATAPTGTKRSGL